MNTETRKQAGYEFDEKQQRGMYQRWNGHITTPSGAKFSYEYGEYPYPVQDAETGEQYDEYAFGLKVQVLVDGSTSFWVDIQEGAAISLLIRAGVFTSERNAWIKERFASHGGIAILS